MKRKEFIELAINSPEKAAKILSANARKLKQCRSVSKTTDILSRILFISDRTIFRDCKKK